MFSEFKARGVSRTEKNKKIRHGYFHRVNHLAKKLFRF